MNLSLSLVNKVELRVAQICLGLWGDLSTLVCNSQNLNLVVNPIEVYRGQTLIINSAHFQGCQKLVGSWSETQKILFRGKECPFNCFLSSHCTYMAGWDKRCFARTHWYVLIEAHHCHCYPPWYHMIAVTNHMASKKQRLSYMMPLLPSAISVIGHSNHMVQGQTLLLKCF